MTSLNPVPNAHVCVYLTIHITKIQLQTTFPKPLYISHVILLSFWLLSKAAKAAKTLPCCAMSARICSCMFSSIVWKIYVGFVADIDIKILKVLNANLNSMLNAHVCVYLTIHVTKLQLQTTFPKPFYIPHFTCIHRDPSR